MRDILPTRSVWLAASRSIIIAILVLNIVIIMIIITIIIENIANITIIIPGRSPTASARSRDVVAFLLQCRLAH